MSDGHKHPNYLMIFGVLTVLTAIEIGVAEIPGWMPSVNHIQAMTIILLVALALVKAMLVALYFMHLKFERKAFIVIVSAPLILAVVLIVALFPDVGWGK